MCVAFICAVVIVLRPASQLGGPYLFLILTIKELVFPPSTSPSAQIEATVVNMAGALFGLGWSNLGLVCATYAARRYGVDSNACRAIRAIFLLVLGFLTGLARSWLPRLTFAARGAGLVSAFLLTTDLDSTKWGYTNFTQLLFVCAIAAAASLFVALVARIFVPTGGYAKDAIGALGLLKDLVHLATTRTIDPPLSATTRPSSPTPTVTPNPVPPKAAQTLEALQRSCLEASLALHTSYAYSAFELRIGRVPVSHIRPLLATVGRVREELAWGVVRAGVHAQVDQSHLHGGAKPEGHTDDQLSKDELELLATLDDPSRTCADAITDSITALQGAIGLCYGIKVPGALCQIAPRSSVDTQAKEESPNPKQPKPRARRSTLVGGECLSAIHAESVRLSETRDALQKQLDLVVRSMNNAHMLRMRPRHASDSRDGSPTRTVGASDATAHHRQLFRKSLYATSLLHISSEILRALVLINSVLELHMNSRPRIFFLRPSWLWLGMSPRALVVERTNEDTNPEQDSPTCQNRSANDDDLGAGVGLSVQEARQGLFQRRDSVLLLSPAVHVEHPAPLRKKIKQWWHTVRATRVTWTSIRRGMYNLLHLPRRVLEIHWNRAKVLTFRAKLSRLLRRIQHSKHARHAIKNAVGVTLLAVPGFLPLGSPGRNYFVSERGAWAIISFMYVLEPNTALTWRVGIMRLCGTFIGAVYAYVTWAICRNNPYGLVAMVTASEIMLTWLVRSSTPGVGIVASVTIPPILFTPYLGLPHPSVIGLAALRGLQISIGIVAAILINHLLFPRHCRVIFLSGMAQALASLTQLYLHLSHRTLNEVARTRSSMLRGAKLDLKLREMISRQNLLVKQMDNEISLMPKPTRLYREGTEIVQRIADLMSGLRRIRENVPQREAIHQVLQHRQHTVSCICIVLFACEHAFRSRRPLPQMLPSPRKAYEALAREMMESLQDAPRATDIGYAIAESEVLDEMVEALETLTTITRELFGTNTWLMDGSCDFAGSFGHGQAWSGAETPVTQTPRAPMRRLDSF